MTQLAKISEFETVLATIDNLHDARRMLSIAQGLVTTARKEYVASERITEVKEDRDRAYDTAVKVGELRLMAEAKLGELIHLEQETGILLKQAQTKSSHPDMTRLIDIGITKQDSFLAQRIAEHKDLIPEVVATAIKNCDIPTRKQLENLILTKARKEPKTTPPLPKGIFDVIYADPPWQYDNTGVNGAASHHYQTMSIDELCALQIPSAENSVLFLWVTNPFLKDAFTVLDTWGFAYKTNIVWVKQNLKKPGAGFYVRGRHELLFICTKGSFTPDMSGKEPIGSVLFADVQEHSKKPQEVYSLIENIYPNCKYLELFARNKREGWISWGNEL